MTNPGPRLALPEIRKLIEDCPGHFISRQQASIYKETGEGHLSLADDILAAIFVYAMALRIEGALWAKMENHFHWNSDAPLDELDDGIVEIARVPRSVARSMHPHSRRRGGRR